MFALDMLYKVIREHTEKDPQAVQIIEPGFLESRNLNVVRNEYQMFERLISFHYDDTWICEGSVLDKGNDGQNLLSLLDGVCKFFAAHNSGTPKKKQNKYKSDFMISTKKPVKFPQKHSMSIDFIK